MRKRIYLILIVSIILISTFSAQARDDKEKVITILGKIVPKADEKGYMVFAGQAKNNTKDLIHSVEIVFEVLDAEGKLMDSAIAPISGKLEGILEGEEVGFFEVKTNVHISTAGSYKHNINWKTFATSDENKSQTK